jgi:hypothetical protein
MITLSIDVTKIDKTRIAKGKYLDLTCVENKGGRDDYGNDGFVTQKATKEEREQRVRMPILGNYKDWSKGRDSERPAPRKQEKPAAHDNQEDMVPF